MDSIDHPLDWWAFGGYAEVMRQTGCTQPQARRRVRRSLAAAWRRTGDPIWRPIGHGGYTRLRRLIMTGQTLDHDLR